MARWDGVNATIFSSRIGVNMVNFALCDLARRLAAQDIGNAPRVWEQSHRGWALPPVEGRSFLGRADGWVRETFVNLQKERGVDGLKGRMVVLRIGLC